MSSIRRNSTSTILVKKCNDRSHQYYLSINFNSKDWWSAGSPTFGLGLWPVRARVRLDQARTFGLKPGFRAQARQIWPRAQARTSGFRAQARLSGPSPTSSSGPNVKISGLGPTFGPEPDIRASPKSRAGLGQFSKKARARLGLTWARRPLIKIDLKR